GRWKRPDSRCARVSELLAVPAFTVRRCCMRRLDASTRERFGSALQALTRNHRFSRRSTPWPCWRSDMKITGIERLEDCFDGSSVYSYQFDQPWTRETILQLSALGELDYFADFPRPFFRIRAAGGLQVKGV